MNASLREFLSRSVVRGDEGLDAVAPRRDVTVLMYFYWNAATASDAWPLFQGALLETWRRCGVLPTVLVTNERHPCVERFAAGYANVEIQIEETLVPGSLKPMSVDCDLRLHRRFETDYVLIVQNDGFPLREGLDEFVGKYDYIGAPWERHMTFYDLYPSHYRVGNGGFSLRSRRICRAASRLYDRWFRHLPYWWYLTGDDTFYCKTLRFWFPGFRRRFRWATVEAAAAFSVENGCWSALNPPEPFGFHGDVGWVNLHRRRAVSAAPSSSCPFAGAEADSGLTPVSGTLYGGVHDR